MLMLQAKSSIEVIIALLQNLISMEREKIQNVLSDLQNEIVLRAAIQKGLDDVANGRVSTQEAVMQEIKAKYNGPKGA